MDGTISIQRLKKDLNQIINKKILRAWKGYGSALFLELGALHQELVAKKNGETITSLVGEWTLSSDGAWVLIRDNKEIFDAEKINDIKINEYLSELENLTINSVELNQKLTLNLSKKYQIIIRRADYGFFTLVSNEKSYISYEKNKPYMHQKFSGINLIV